MRMAKFKPMLEKCPKELEYAMQEIFSATRDFAMVVEVSPDDELDDIKQSLQIARENLYKIFGILLTTVRIKHKYEDGSILDLGLRGKFEEDIGSVMGALRKMEIVSSDLQEQVNFYLKYSVDLKTAFNFLVAQPIMAANNSTYTDFEDYMLKIFNVISSNAAVLGYSTKSVSSDTSSTTKGFPDGKKLILQAFNKAQQEKNGKPQPTQTKKQTTEQTKKEELRKELEEIAREQEEDEEEDDEEVADLSFETV